MRKYTSEISLNNNSSHGIIFNEIKEGSRVLEFGCASGRVSKLLCERNCKVYGIEIMPDAFADAKKFLFDGICSDIEKYEWKEKFSGTDFDVIIFSDVLEHLRNPEKVLFEAAKFLKEDGFIIASIPNIAHGDILAKLYQNRFDYTSEGLLDNTHIRFWGYNNLIELFSSGELFLAWVNGTHAPLGATEQATDKSKKLLTDLRKKQYGDVYQFVFKLYRREYAEKSGMKYENRLNDGFSAFLQVYFNTGEGYSESFSEKHYLRSDDVKLKITLPDGIKTIRLDPTDSSACCVYEIHALCGDRELEIISYNGRAYGDIFIFSTNDPSFEFDVTGFDGGEATIAYKLLDLSDEQAELAITETDIMKKSQEDRERAYAEEKSELEKRISDIEEESDIMIKKEQAKIDEKELEIEKLTKALRDNEERITEYEKELDHFKLHYTTAMAQREDLKAQLAHVTNERDVIKNSASWKITAPARRVLDVTKKIFREVKAKTKSALSLTKKGFKSLKSNGFKATVRKIKNRKRRTAQLGSMCKDYYTLSAREREHQSSHKFDREIKISILVPLYNTPIKFLEEMINSVKAQTYGNWELCLADGSDAEHCEVEKVCRRYASHDSRIKYEKLEKNLGISENTNACIRMAAGDYIALFDHDDILHPSALFEVMRAICEKGADMIYTDENTFSTIPEEGYCPHFKPDFCPDTLRSYNYICHLTVFKKTLLEEIGGGFRKEYDGSQDYDIILRLTEKAKNIVHIPKILYFWRSHQKSVASDISAKPYTVVAAKKALSAHLERVGLKGEVKDSAYLSTYKINYEIEGTPLVSVIIPNKDHTDILKQCLDSIYKLTTYPNFEIIIVENNSTEEETFKFYGEIEKKYQNLKVVTWEYEFNYSKINNFGFKFTKGEHIVLLNNDIEFITPSWIEEMLMFTQRRDVGAAGIMLYYPDNTIQHAGVIIGIGGVAGHSHKYFKRGEPGYSFRLTIAQNLSAVTAACVMMRRDVFEEIGGLDESFAVAFNDVDMCMRICKAGYRIVWTPYAEAYHHESKSRGLEDTPEKQQRFKGEVERFFSKWDKELKEGDPCYNPNLTLEREDFTLR